MTFINTGTFRKLAGEIAYVQAAKLPDDGLKSIDFTTLVDILSEGQIEGSATASRLGITNQTATRYKNSLLKL